METIQWETLAAHLVSASPSALTLGGTRGASIGFAPNEGRLWVRLPCAADTVASIQPFVEIRIEVRSLNGSHCLEIATTSAERFRELHRFGCLLAEVFEQPETNAILAFETALSRWQELTALISTLSREQVLGLIAELLVLRAHINQVGLAAISAWTGRDPAVPERHDFRFANVDVEVKATRSAVRNHVIHGLAQLAPVSGRPLYLLSVRLELAGAGSGWSLRSLIKDIRSKLSSSGRASRHFDSCLTAAGVSESITALYDVRYRLAAPCRLIEVEAGLPVLTHARLGASFSAEELARVTDVTYRLNVEGLGVVDGDPQFSQVLGDLSIGEAE